MTIDLVYFAALNQRPASFQKSEDLREVCIPNISPLERKKRSKFAIGQFIVTLIVLGVLIAMHLNPLWRLPLLFMFSASTVSYFQVLDKT